MSDFQFKNVNITLQYKLDEKDETPQDYKINQENGNEINYYKFRTKNIYNYYFNKTLNDPKNSKNEDIQTEKLKNETDNEEKY